MKPHEIRMLPWPHNLVCSILGSEGYDFWKEQIPADFDESVKYVLEETLTDREIDILQSFFRDRIALRIIGGKYGIKEQRCAQIKNKAIRRLRHPSRTKYIKYGMAEVARRAMEPPEEIPIAQHLIEELDLSVRSYNILKRANFQSIDDLTRYSRSQLRNAKNVGLRTIDEVERKLNNGDYLYILSMSSH